MTFQSVHIINLYDGLPTSSHWLAHAFADRADVTWSTFCNHEAAEKLPRNLPLRYQISNVIAAHTARKTMRDHPRSLLVTHGPRPAFYGALLKNQAKRHQRRLAFSFNFTDLPTGSRRRLMANAFRNIERFVVFSTMEKSLYADYFDIPFSSIDMIHWGVSAPKLNESNSRLPERILKNEYVCAIGSQARDYATLFAAAQKLSSIQFVVVAKPENLVRLSVPSNVLVRCNIALAEAQSILQGSKFMVLPLRSSETPCGHVTVVSAMHFGVATIATNSTGVSDYITDRVTGLLVSERDSDELRLAIESLYGDPQTSAALGDNAKTFATLNCSEANTVRYLRKVLSEDFAL